MPRLNSHGKFILSASEVGSYTVCPEAWRLTVIEGEVTKSSEKQIEGQIQHQKWAEDYAESVYLGRAARIVLLTVVLSVTLYIMFQSWQAWKL